MSATSMLPQSEPEDEYNPEAQELADLLALAGWHNDTQKFIERQQELEKTATQLIIELTTDQLDHQLSRYKKLRHNEDELRERVHFLERQVALAGHIQTPVSLGLQLKAEKEKLAKVRDELKALAAELQTILDIPFEERTKIDADRLAQLIDEVKAKREQEFIYRRNIYYLEELQAKLGLAVRIDLFNELHLTRAKRDDIISELKSLEQQIQEEWQLEPETVSAIVAMSSQEIRDHAQKIALKKYEEEMQSVRSRKAVDHSFDEPKQQGHNNPQQNSSLQHYLRASTQLHRKTQSGSG
jgi:hypothetical protein